MLSKSLFVLFVTVTWVAWTSAHATGFMVARFGGEHGNPVTSDPTAIYYNPAGLAFAQGTNAYVEGIMGYRTLTVNRDPNAIDHPNVMPGTPDVTANSGEGKLANFIASPFVGVSTDFGVKNLGVGASLSVPFGGTASFSKVDKWVGNTRYPGAVDGPQRWSETEGTIKSTYVSVAGAYKLPGNFSVGLSANLVLSTINDNRAYNQNGTDDLIDGNGQLEEGRALLDVSGTTFSLGAGVAWQPDPRVMLGLSYQSQPAFGDMTLTGQATKKLGASTPTVDQVEVHQALPDIVRLGASFRATPQIEARLWGSYERWSVFQNQCILNATVDNRACALDDRGQPTAAANSSVLNNIPRHWQDAFSVRASGSYWLQPNLELEAGLGYSSNAVPDQTLEAGLPDFDNVSATVGARVKLLDNKLKLVAEYTQLVFFERTTAPRPDHENPPFLGVSRAPDQAGTYSQSVGVFTIGVDYLF